MIKNRLLYNLNQRFIYQYLQMKVANQKLSIYFLFFFFVYVARLAPKQILLEQIKLISLEVGQLYEVAIHQFFDIYQSTQFTNFSKKSQNTSSVCQVEQTRKSQFAVKGLFLHYKLLDPQIYYLGNNKIFLFKDLAKLREIIDVAEFEDQIVILFENGFYSFYNINSGGQISQNNVKLLYNETFIMGGGKYEKQVKKSVVAYGNFLQYFGKNLENHLIFIGEHNSLILKQKNSFFQNILGYEPVGFPFQKAIIVNQTIYIAANTKGVLMYQINATNNSLTKINTFLPYHLSNNLKVFLSPTNIEWDPVNNMLIIIDDEWGIHWVPVPENITTESMASIFPSPILIERCNSLQILIQEKTLAATCPELILVSLVSGKHSIIDEIQFSPKNLIVHQSRIMIFGDFRFVIYDLNTKLVQKGESKEKIDFALTKNLSTVLINNFLLQTGQFHPIEQKIKCFIKSEGSAEYLGQIQANLSIQGICKQLSTINFQNQSQQSTFNPSKKDRDKIINYKSEEGNCQLIYQVKLEITNSQIISYWWYIVLSLLISCGLCGYLTIYCYKDIKAKKRYNQLHQEASSVCDVTDENIESSVKQEK